jgi:replication-associated recombination protein RarA
MIPPLSLDDRRPKLLSQIVGNGAVVGRLRKQMHKGRPPRRILTHGPSGAGKTTKGRILAHYNFCLNPVGIGDPCDQCAHCKKELDAFFYYHEWTGSQIATNWQWWKDNMTTILSDSRVVVFIDEAQDLERVQQAEFRTRLESAQAMMIFTTTHLHMLDDALINRFGVNVYELKRPTTEEVTDHLEFLCAKLGVMAQRHHLVRVAENLGCDLRKCVDFAYTALDQTDGGIVDDAFVNIVLGLEPLANPDQVDPPKRRSRF